MDQPNIPAAQGEREVNVIDILSVLVKRRMLIFCITVAAAVLSVGYTLTLKNVYTATARILPPQQDGGAGISSLLGRGGLAALAGGGGGSGDLYVGILNSRTVADDVIKKLDLLIKLKAKNADIARFILAKKVRVQAEKSGIILIMAKDKNPQLAADLSNAFVEELGRTTVKLNLSKVGIERVFLENRLVIVKSDLKKAEDALKSFAQSNKVVQVDSQAKASIEGIAKLKAELASREVQLSVMRTYQTDESPEVTALQAGLRKLQEEISRLSGFDKDGEGIPSIGNIPGVGLEYARRMRDLKIQEAVFEQLTRQYEMAKLTEAKDTSSVQVLDSAVVPIQKSGPKRSIIVILTTFIAFVMSILIVFFQEYFAKLSMEDAEIIREMRQSLNFRKCQR